MIVTGRSWQDLPKMPILQRFLAVHQLVVNVSLTSEAIRGLLHVIEFW